MVFDGHNMYGHIKYIIIHINIIPMHFHIFIKKCTVSEFSGFLTRYAVPINSDNLWILVILCRVCNLHQNKNIYNLHHCRQPKIAFVICPKMSIYMTMYSTIEYLIDKRFDYSLVTSLTHSGMKNNFSLPILLYCIVFLSIVYL